MKASLLVGRLWGTEIRLHASLLLLIPYALVTFRPDGTADTLRVFLLIAAIFFCVGLHEVGHTLAARSFGVPVTSIVLWPLGGVANLEHAPEKPWPNIVIAAAGPLTNLVLFAGLLSLIAAERLVSSSARLHEIGRLMRNLDIFPFLVALAIANLSLALFNLVPVYPLDGGQIARGLLKLVIGEIWADRIMLVFSLPLALGLTVLGFANRDVVIILTGFILLAASLSLNARLYNALTMLVLYLADRGGYALKRLDFDAAHAAYTRAIQRTPNRPGPYLSRAVASMNLFDLPSARADVERALQLDPTNVIARTLLGELSSLEGNTAAAIAAYDEAIRVRPNWALAYLDRGSLHQKLGNLHAARQDMDRAVELGRGSVVHNLVRSILRWQMGDPAGAQQDADAALRYAPQWMLTFPEIFLENFTGHLDWALDYYRRAIERMPKAYQAYQGRADACRVNGRLDWAIADYTRAIQLAPKQAELYLNRGRSYQALGYLPQAAQDYRQAIACADRTHMRRQAETLLRAITA